MEPGGGVLQLLRPGSRRARRELRRRPRRAVGEPPRGAPEPVSAGHCRAAGDHLPQPLRAAALVLHALRGACRQPRKALPRNRVRGCEEEIGGVHVPALLPGMRRRAPARGVPGGARGGHADRGLLRALRAARDRVARRGGALRHRPPRRAADRARDLRAAAVPRERRHRLLDGPASATLSGGEAQRFAWRRRSDQPLVGVLFMLDEPSIGFTERDNPS